MGPIDRLEHDVELLRIRQRAARREGIVFVVILVLLLLAAALLSSQAGYEPDGVGLFTTAVMSLGLTILASSRIAETRTVGHTLDLVEVLRRTMEEGLRASSH